MKPAAVVITALAGAALFEAALIPGILIGAAGVLAPALFAGRFSGPRRKTRTKGKPAASPAKRSPTFDPVARDKVPVRVLPPLTLKQAIWKTITFRLIVTSLDFGSNIFVIGEFAPAAGLSAYGLVAGPIFYFLHEVLWARSGAVDPGSEDFQDRAETRGPGGLRMSRALAKTITYRLFATTADFTANYVVVGDLAKAAGLTSFGFVVGPFVYYGHEKAWDYFRRRDAIAPPAPEAHHASSSRSTAVIQTSR